MLFVFIFKNDKFVKKIILKWIFQLNSILYIRGTVSTKWVSTINKAYLHLKSPSSVQVIYCLMFLRIYYRSQKCVTKSLPITFLWTLKATFILWHNWYIFLHVNSAWYIFLYNLKWYYFIKITQLFFWKSDEYVIFTTSFSRSPN